MNHTRHRNVYITTCLVEIRTTIHLFLSKYVQTKSFWLALLIIEMRFCPINIMFDSLRPSHQLLFLPIDCNVCLVCFCFSCLFIQVVNLGLVEIT